MSDPFEVPIRLRRAWPVHVALSALNGVLGVGFCVLAVGLLTHGTTAGRFVGVALVPVGVFGTLFGILNGLANSPRLPRHGHVVRLDDGGIRVRFVKSEGFLRWEDCTQVIAVQVGRTLRVAFIPSTPAAVVVSPRDATLGFPRAATTLRTSCLVWPVLSEFRGDVVSLLDAVRRFRPEILVTNRLPG